MIQAKERSSRSRSANSSNSSRAEGKADEAGSTESDHADGDGNAQSNAAHIMKLFTLDDFVPSSKDIERHSLAAATRPKPAKELAESTQHRLNQQASKIASMSEKARQYANATGNKRVLGNPVVRPLRLPVHHHGEDQKEEEVAVAMDQSSDSSLHQNSGRDHSRESKRLTGVTNSAASPGLGLLSESNSHQKSNDHNSGFVSMEDDPSYPSSEMNES